MPSPDCVSQYPITGVATLFLLGEPTVVEGGLLRSRSPLSPHPCVISTLSEKHGRDHRFRADELKHLTFGLWSNGTDQGLMVR